MNKDQETTVQRYREAAEQGDAEAQSNLGVCYYFGEGVKKDKKEAVKWFRKAAEQGNALAQSSLGKCYDNGDGVKEFLISSPIFWPSSIFVIFAGIFLTIQCVKFFPLGVSGSSHIIAKLFVSFGNPYQ